MKLAKLLCMSVYPSVCKLGDIIFMNVVINRGNFALGMPAMERTNTSNSRQQNRNTSSSTLTGVPTARDRPRQGMHMLLLYISVASFRKGDIFFAIFRKVGCKLSVKCAY